MNFSENELFRKDQTSSFLAYGGADKRVLEFPANCSEFSKCTPQNDGSNSIQIQLEAANLFINIIQYGSVRHVGKNVSAYKLLKTAFRSSEKP